MADITQLQQLFDSVAPIEEPAPSGAAAMTPADLGGGGGAGSGAGGGASSASAGEASTADPKAIWDAAEVPEDDVDDDADDPRKRPEFDILYKQDVMAEDMYLGMGDKDPSSSSCDRMVVKIQMPGERIKDVDLDVTKQRLVVQSPIYKLSTYLPYPCKHKEGNAKWDASKDTLTVTLPIIRKQPWEI